MAIRRKFRVLLALVTVFLTISCDQITKSKVRQELVHNEVVNIVENAFVLTRAENSGAAMGLGSSLPQIWKLLFLQFLPLLVLLYMFRVIWTREMSIIKVLAFSLIIGGGIGNIYDRVFRSSVTDFLYVDLELVRTGIFNLADVSVMTGALIICACSFSKSADETNKTTNNNISVIKDI